MPYRVKFYIKGEVVRVAEYLIGTGLENMFYSIDESDDDDGLIVAYVDGHEYDLEYLNDWVSSSCEFNSCTIDKTTIEEVDADNMLNARER